MLFFLPAKELISFAFIIKKLESKFILLKKIKQLWKTIQNKTVLKSVRYKRFPKI